MRDGQDARSRKRAKNRSGGCTVPHIEAFRTGFLKMQQKANMMELLKLQSIHGLGNRFLSNSLDMTIDSQI